jgi:uncharacterized protein (TIGR02145 family)
VPDSLEIIVLSNFLGGKDIAGGKMKSQSNLWSIPNVGASNEAGFNSIPGGSKSTDGSFLNLGYTSNFWSETSRTRYTTSNHQSVLSINSISPFLGSSIRCVKD